MNWIRPVKRTAIYLRDGHRCLWCEVEVRPKVNISLDHFLPRELGGGNEASNVFTACISCNADRKHDPALAYAHRVGRLEALDRIIEQLEKPITTRSTSTNGTKTEVHEEHSKETRRGRPSNRASEAHPATADPTP